MASHQLAIAKASLAASLLRPDPESVSREKVAEFHSLLDEALVRCSPSNIQTCKTWLLDNVVPSAGRITALAKYLLALSGSFSPETSANGSSNGPSKAENSTSSKRKRLHLLYLLNDVLHHTKYHSTTSSRHASLASNLQPHLVDLFTSAASFDSSKHPKHHKKISDLVDIWETHSFHSLMFLESLRQAIKTAGTINSGTSHPAIESAISEETYMNNVTTRQVVRNAPYLMPATHGDPSTPYYDLPAGNIIPHIAPNSTMAINPELVKPLQFVPGPAEESLANVVRDFLSDIDGIYSISDSLEFETVVPDVDEMGQPVVENDDDGTIGARESYYGWSIAFCKKMKKRKRGKADPDSIHRAGGRGRSRSNSRNRSRYSSSRSPVRNDGKGRGHGSSPSRSKSRSRSRSGHAQGNNTRSPGSTRNSSRRRSTSAERSKRQRRSPARETELRNPPPRASSNQAFVTPIDQIDNPFSTFMPAPPVVPNASSFQHNFPIGQNGLPVPPPPPFHQGPWPPPPPSLPAGMQFNPGQFPNFSSTEFPQASPMAPPPPGVPGFHHSSSPVGRHNIQSPPGSQPPPAPPPGLRPSWQEQSGQQRWEGQQGSRGDSRGAAPPGGNWFSGQDPRRR